MKNLPLGAIAPLRLEEHGNERQVKTRTYEEYPPVESYRGTSEESYSHVGSRILLFRISM